MRHFLVSLASALRIFLWIIAFLAFLALLPVLAIVVINLGDDTLTAQAQRALHWEAPEAAFQNNGYIHLSGIHMPATEDAQQEGLRIVRQHVALYAKRATVKQWQSLPKFDPPAFIEQAPWRCAAEIPHCVTHFLANAQAIEASREEMLVHEKRFESILNAEKFHEIIPPSPYAPLPQFQFLLSLHQRQLAKATLAMAAQQQEQAMELLLTNAKRSRKLLRQSQSMIGRAIALHMIYVDARVLNELLDQYPALRRQIPRLMPVVASISDAQYALDAALRAEGLAAINLIQRDVVEYAQLPIDQIHEIESPVRRSWWSILRDRLMVKVLVAPNNTANLAMQWIELTAQASRLPAHQLDAAYAAALAQHNEQLGSNLLGLFYPVNPVGKTLLLVGRSSGSNFVERQHDLDAYLRLTQIKLGFMEQGLPASQIPKALMDMPDALKNPYTLQPMQWDAASRQLTFEGRQRPKYLPNESKLFSVKVPAL